MATPIDPAAASGAPAATAPQAPVAPAPSGDPDWKAEAEKWKALSRQNEATAKANKAAADELQQIKDSQLTDQQKAQKEAEDARTLAAQSAAELARYKVAAAKNVPVELLTATDEASLNAQADALLKFAGGNGQSNSPDLGQGNRGGTAPLDPNAWLRRMSGRH